MFRPQIFLYFLLSCSALLLVHATEFTWDNDWRFHLNDAPGAEAPTWEDNDWRPLTLPHDWSIEGATHPTETSSGGGGFFPTGIGWYRKTFTPSSGWQGNQVWIDFDGVYRDSEVWLNGHSLGRRPNGFASFRYELTPHLKFGAENVIAVRVDNSAQPNSRYYTGSGITRHVRLRVLNPIHVESDTFFVTTEQLDAKTAALKIRATMRNDSPAAAALTLTVEIISPQGEIVGTSTAKVRLDAGQSAPVNLGLAVNNPQPWSPNSPTLYRASYHLKSGRRGVDYGNAQIGLRTIHVSAKNGFELNGTPVKLFGANVHDDNGPLGTAAFDRAEERRAELLKAAGFNAVRTAHNPPSPAFLAACDRLGLLILEEAFDGWKKKKVAQDYGRDFDAWSQRDLDAMIVRDRNHPSVVLWDIGNEPYERGSPSGAAIAQQLADRARELDPSRPVTAGINGLGKTREWSGVDPVFAALDIAGYNYEIAHHATDHARLPNRVIMISESYHTETFANCSIVHDMPYVIGDFVWSAIDYLGEAGIGRVFPSEEPVRPHWEGSHYPWHGGACGDLDLTGLRKPLSHYRNLVWDRGEKLFAAVRVPSPDGKPWNVSLWAPPPLLTHWTWPGQENHELTVEVYSRHESVRLYLNDRLLGEQPTTRTQEFKAIFSVPYAAGTLRAVGLDASHETESFTLVTAGTATGLRLTADRTTLHANNQDLAFITVEVVDSAGHVVPSATNTITYTLTGPGVIAGIGSGDLTSTETYRANPRQAHQGRALLVIRTTASPGEITVTATAAGLTLVQQTLRSLLP